MITERIFFRPTNHLKKTLSCSCTSTNTTISRKNRLMHTFIFNTILLTQCHSGMFQPSEVHLQKIRHIFFNRKVKKWVSGCKIQFSEQLVIYYTPQYFNYICMYMCVYTYIYICIFIYTYILPSLYTVTRYVSLQRVLLFVAPVPEVSFCTQDGCDES